VSKIIVPYGTTEGQTAEIADYIVDVLRAHGHDAKAVDIKDAPADVLDGWDAVIIGASIHMGRHADYVCDFARRHRATLELVPSAFFSVSLAAHGDTETAEGYIEQFEQQTGWRPADVAMFAGALLYTKYGFLKRHLLKKIAHDKPGDLGQDLSRDYIYTEWDGVRRFVDDFLATRLRATVNSEDRTVEG
jgi:menaquinone-dependent protoporphyrinogen oxidase